MLDICQTQISSMVLIPSFKMDALMPIGWPQGATPQIVWK
jgi:hypothetical protein